MKSIKISEAIRIVKPEYVFLKLVPNNSIRNNNTHKLARAIAALYKNTLQNVKKDEIKVKRIFGKQLFIPTKISYETPSKVAYLIYLEKKKIEFYFIVPRSQLSVIKEKMSDVWASITIEQVDQLPEFGREATKYQLSYTKEDALSLAVDRRSNDLLVSTLNVVDVMEEVDKVGIFYNFIPSSQFSWRAAYRNTIEKVRANKPVDRDKTGTSYLLKMAFTMLVGFTNAVAESLAGEKKKQEANLFVEALERMNGGKKISEATHKKATATVLDTQIIVMSESHDAVRQHNNARSMAQSFDTISEPSGGNSLRYRPLRSAVKPTAYSISGAAVNKVGDEECSNFLALPGRDVLERYNFIDKVETQETEVPEDLRTGVMRIGVNRYRGIEQMAYLSTDKEFRNLTLVLIGPTRAGKSTLIGNLSIDAIKAGECVVIFDYIGSCQLSSEVAALFPPDKQLVIDCENTVKMQGLGYNEVGISVDPFRQYDNAKKQATQLLTLINAVNANGAGGETHLSPKMERYLSSAAVVVFVSSGSIRDVFGVLQDHRVRREWLRKVPVNQMENLKEYMDSLAELDDADKKGVVVGTKDNLITGIIDRLSKLKANTYMEAMLKRSTAGNIDLVKELQKPQLITIRMPEAMFATDAERDVYTTYWITKLWLALQIREQRVGGDRSKLTKVNLIIDELYQVENTQKFLSDKLSRLAKFGCKPIISAHYLNQIKFIRDELRSANASYMLISGCDKKNFSELQSELHPYQEEDLLNLSRYHSLNLIKNKDGYARFITKLPKPVSK